MSSDEYLSDGTVFDRERFQGDKAYRSMILRRFGRKPFDTSLLVIAEKKRMAIELRRIKKSRLKHRLRRR